MLPKNKTKHFKVQCFALTIPVLYYLYDNARTILPIILQRKTHSYKFLLLFCGKSHVSVQSSNIDKCSKKLNKTCLL